METPEQRLARLSAEIATVDDELTAWNHLADTGEFIPPLSETQFTGITVDDVRVMIDELDDRYDKLVREHNALADQVGA